MLSPFSHVQLFVTPWTLAHQAPLSMGLSRWEYWSELPCPSPGHLSDPGIKPVSPEAPAFQADSLPWWKGLKLLYDPAIPLLGAYFQKNRSYFNLSKFMKGLFLIEIILKNYMARKEMQTVKFFFNWISYISYI